MPIDGGLVEGGAGEVDAEVEAGGAIHIGELHLEENLRFDGRHFDAQKVDDFAESGGDGHHPIRGDEVFDAAAHEGSVVVEGDLHLVAGEIACDLFADGVETIGAGADGEVVGYAPIVFQPDDE